MGREIQSVIPMISYEDGIAAMDGIIPDRLAGRTQTPSRRG